MNTLVTIFVLTAAAVDLHAQWERQESTVLNCRTKTSLREIHDCLLSAFSPLDQEDNLDGYLMSICLDFVSIDRRVYSHDCQDLCVRLPHSSPQRIKKFALQCGLAEWSLSNNQTFPCFEATKGFIDESATANLVPSAALCQAECQSLPSKDCHYFVWNHLTTECVFFTALEDQQKALKSDKDVISVMGPRYCPGTMTTREEVLQTTSTGKVEMMSESFTAAVTQARKGVASQQSKSCVMMPNWVEPM